MTETYKWHEVYRAALLETDWSKIGKDIQEAENGIRARLHEFSLNHGGTPEENRSRTPHPNWRRRYEGLQVW